MPKKSVTPRRSLRSGNSSELSQSPDRGVLRHSRKLSVDFVDLGSPNRKINKTSSSTKSTPKKPVIVDLCDSSFADEHNLSETPRSPSKRKPIIKEASVKPTESLVSSKEADRRRLKRPREPNANSSWQSWFPRGEAMDVEASTSESSRGQQRSPHNEMMIPGICPVPGCDSRGNLDGRNKTHEYKECCPNYHNLTRAEVKTLNEALRDRKNSYSNEVARASISRQSPLKESPRRSPSKQSFSSQLRRKALANHAESGKNSQMEAIRSAGGSSPPRESLPSPSKNNLRDERLKLRSRLADQAASEEWEGDERGSGVPLSHEPSLANITTPQDLQLFRMAQARVAERAEMNPSDTLPIPNQKRINWVHIGRTKIKTWYRSAYPEHLACLETVYICAFCLKCVPTVTVLQRHYAKCQSRHPPGDEIYRDGNLSFFEVDGNMERVYCQNLCLLAKLWLDHKTLYHEVEPFLFYVLTQSDSTGCHLIGYFSKEKNSEIKCNLSCLMTLPSHQRKGYGRLLIEFSYLLSRREGLIGSPEHPLTDLGLRAYRDYWKNKILAKVYNLEKNDRTTLSFKELSQETGIHPNDIVSTLQYYGMIKISKGQHLFYKNPQVYDEFVKKMERKRNGEGRLEVKEDKLEWHTDEESEEETD